MGHGDRIGRGLLLIGGLGLLLLGWLMAPVWQAYLGPGGAAPELAAPELAAPASEVLAPGPKAPEAALPLTESSVPSEFPALPAPSVPFEFPLLTEAPPLAEPPAAEAVAPPVDVLINLAAIEPERFSALVALVRDGGKVVSTTAFLTTPGDEARRVTPATVFVRPDRERLSELVSLVDAGALTVEVEDDGPGIPEADHEQVFRPFYRLDHARNQDSGSTGLGLAIARDIARIHGGDIKLSRSQLGGLKAVLKVPV